MKRHAFSCWEPVGRVGGWGAFSERKCGVIIIAVEKDINSFAIIRPTFVSQHCLWSLAVIFAFRASCSFLVLPYSNMLKVQIQYCGSPFRWLGSRRSREPVSKATKSADCELQESL